MRSGRWIGGAVFCAGLALSGQPAAAGDNVRVLQGESFWEGDPGPVSDPYWTQGQYKYDPNGYLLRNWRDADQFHLMTVIGPHSGKDNCVFRRRVTVSDWEFRHPFLRVCRTPPNDKK
ncbi:hypothetical protein [Rhodoblastus sp.]|uniref:hypothetical protein n=1 Tax=Rhodoblastus sp. TaxID=1962975 RepID=UPI0035B146CC